jgi:hypothetical protein
VATLVVVLGAPAVTVRLAGALGVLFVFFWFLIAVPVVPRDIWKRERVS